MFFGVRQHALHVAPRVAGQRDRLVGILQFAQALPDAGERIGAAGVVPLRPVLAVQDVRRPDLGTEMLERVRLVDEDPARADGVDDVEGEQVVVDLERAAIPRCPKISAPASTPISSDAPASRPAWASTHLLSVRPTLM